MTKNILIGSSIAAAVVIGAIILFRKFSGSSASSATNAVSAPVIDNSGALKNNYVIWSYAIIKMIADSGNVQAAKDLQDQLKTAWYKSGPIPIYDHTPVTAILPSNGIFQTPSVLGQDNSNLLRQVFENSCTTAAVIAKNYIQGNTHGQAIGARQGWIREYMKQVYANIGDVNSVPRFGSSIIVLYEYAYKNAFPNNYHGGQPGADDVNTIINMADNNSNGILSALA